MIKPLRNALIYYIILSADISLKGRGEVWWAFDTLADCGDYCTLKIDL